MFTRRAFAFSIVAIGLLTLLGLILLATPHVVLAQSSTPASGTNTCRSCHEDLYYQYDTGKSYCLTESPMQCVDCHAGDPQAITPENAHKGYIKYPVINQDDSRCYQCHPEQAKARVEKFRQVAGIHPVIVASSSFQSVSMTTQSVSNRNKQTQADELFFKSGIFSLVLVAGLVLTGFIIYMVRHV